jgi:hypothetical protein
MFLSAIMVSISVALLSCGGGGSDTIVTQILSDPAFDGDIVQNPLTGAYTIAQDNTQSVFAGIDPSTGAEYRAFLDFPLTGVGGVPGNAVIVSATLDIVISSILPQPLFDNIPIRIDLVSLSTSGLDRIGFQPDGPAGARYHHDNTPDFPSRLRPARNC